MWAYEARRLFRDRLVGEKAVDQFDAILGSVLQSDWSASLSSLDQDGGAFYVTWGSPQSSKADGLGNPFGRPLGRLSATDMQEVVAKAVTTFGELFLSLFSLSLSLSLSLMME
jgi:dynein heavy chain 2